MGQGIRWTHEELMIAMNLYCKLPFGQLDQRNSLIIEVSQKLGRTPSSLSMKLCNLASLDPRQQARGIKGLGSTSKADREIWNLFNSDWERYGVESEESLQFLLAKAVVINPVIPPLIMKSQNKYPIAMPVKAPSGPTETELTVRARIGQRFFRQSVLASYNCRCCITGNPIPELLVASHILPWGSYPEHRLNPRNGLCLAQTQDAAFDRGLITFDEDYRLVLGPYLREYIANEALERNFFAYEGQQIQMPDKFLPDSDFMQKHREEVFQHP
ncbi:MAG: HNH endonuclease [Deltaproteobacteria bacterium]|nr:HNH endonuclease [Deltaproteobacteria bacterium]